MAANTQRLVLRKALPDEGRRARTRAPPAQPRSSSTPRPTNSSNRLHKPESPNRLNPQSAQAPSEPQGRARASSLAPPPAYANAHNRAVSSPVNSGPPSYHSEEEGSAETGGRPGKRRSWLGGLARSRNASQEHNQGPGAWVVMGGTRMDYNLAFLTNAQKVPELWAENGDTFIYLFPRETGRGPSFKVFSSTLSSSPQLLRMIHGDAYSSRPSTRSFDGRGNPTIVDATRNLAIEGPRTPPYTPKNPMDSQSTSDGYSESIRSFEDGPREIHLYFPTPLTSNGPEFTPQDIQSLVAVRNLFAFFEGQQLVRTRDCPSMYQVLLSVASQLRKFEFTNIDGSTYGEAASSAFGFFLEVEKLGDVSQSREKTIEGIILGERMRSTELYNEAFAHAVGKYHAVQEIRPELFSQISQDTRNRLERAYLDLNQRQKAADLRLMDFEFPSLFAGVAASTSSEESKYVHFKAWKSNFLSLRKQILSYYRDLHGQWPPKASSKKNRFVEGGLNRLVLRGLYADLCGLYDLLTDRESLTTRSYDASDDKYLPTVDPSSAALRRLLGEFDRSSPPVQPPIPFDLPRIPTIATVDANYNLMGPKEQNKLATRKLKDHETLLVIAKSHNLDTSYKTPFLEMYKAYEEKEARGKNCSELADMRYGHWIFLYAVLQSLPMLVVDAPGLHYTEGVEYFLCEPSMGNPPWMEDASVKREWYGVQSSGGVVSMPSDLVTHGVEGIYRRSHCWTVAEKWIGRTETGISLPASTDAQNDRGEMLSPLAPPPGFGGGEFGGRPSSRGRERNSVGSMDGLSPRDDRRSRDRQSKRNSIAIGLERLPIPIGPGSATPTASPAGSRGTSPAGMGMYNGSRRTSSAGVGAGTGGGTTFDDILGKMDQGQEKGKKK